MNELLQQVARQTIKDGLDQLSEKHRSMFKRMYSPNDLDIEINILVNRLPVVKLEWAMQQVTSTLEKNNV